MPATPIEDWTRGPAKWAAVIVLAIAGAGALAWSFAAGSARPGRFVRADEVRTPVEVSSGMTGGRGAADADRGGVEPRMSEGADGRVESDALGAALGPPTPGRMPGAGDAGTEIDASVESEAIAPSEPAEGVPASASRKINVNVASSAELELLPGIGPALAKRIIADRERLGKFRGIDDLDRVPGIGPRTIEKLRPLVIAD